MNEQKYFIKLNMDKICYDELYHKIKNTICSDGSFVGQIENMNMTHIFLSINELGKKEPIYVILPYKYIEIVAPLKKEDKIKNE